MPTTPSSDPHFPYLVSVTVTRAELDSLADAVADAYDGAHEDGDASLVASAERLSGLMNRIERSWRTQSTQHTFNTVADATADTVTTVETLLDAGQPVPGSWSLSGVDDDDDQTEPCSGCGQDTYDTAPWHRTGCPEVARVTAERAPGAWLGDVRTITVTLTEAQRVSLMYALSQEAEYGREHSDHGYARNLETIAVVVAHAWDQRPAQSDSETLDRATLTDAELGV